MSLLTSSTSSSCRLVSFNIRVGIETSFGRFELDFNEIESARIDPSEILTQQAAAG